MIFFAPFQAVAATAAQDLWEILTPADVVIELLEISVTQSNITDNEYFRFTIARVTGSPTSGSGGGTITPAKLEDGLTASGCTVERNNTTRLSGGTKTVIVEESKSILSGWHWIPTPELRIRISPSTRALIGLESTPNASTTLSGTVAWDELGG